MNIIFLLSHNFDYSNLICSDVGPEYAKDMGWNYDSIQNLDAYQKYICIIDNRITKEECVFLEHYIKQNIKRKFAFTIVDPCIETSCSYYHVFLQKIYLLPNILYISKYQPKEWCLDLDPGSKKTIWVPYPYNKAKELPIDKYHKRKMKIIYTGALYRDIYPLRYSFCKKNSTSVKKNFTDFLVHPGYPDIGEVSIHNIIKDDYLSFLSKYKFMFLCPSRCSIELLKYRECAYAGCVPFGQLPHSISKDVPVIKWTSRMTLQQFLRTVSAEDRYLLNYVNSYRNFFRDNRNPLILNAELQKKLHKIKWY